MTALPKNGKILVIGAGNFGTCLGDHLAREGWEVEILARAQHIVDGINDHRKNPKYLSTITLAPSMKAINHINADQINNYRAVVVAVPMQAVRDTLKDFAQHLNTTPLLISAVKGIEIKSGHFFGQVIKDLFGVEIATKSVVLSGPSFAIEVAQKLPTAVVSACEILDRARMVQEIFHTSFFRVYTSQDPVGLEVAGALKNVIAIAAGACAGLGFQMNSLSAIMTRGLAEMTHVGAKLGANPITFQGLGGVGDLFLTCSSNKSRNYSLGYKLGQGLSVHEALGSLGSVAEGFTTAKAAYNLVQGIGVDAPIIEEVYQVLYHKKPIQSSLYDLINRDAKAEFTLP